MNRIDQLFKAKKDQVLSIYMTAGYPELNDTVPALRYLQEYGADMVEIGMPFSDPLADGPVIQESSQRALQNGMNISYLFDILHDIRNEISIPLVLMGYLNPVLQYGFSRFIEKCMEVGIDGLIIPDLPPDEYNKLYREQCENAGIHMIMLITPYTSEERIKKIISISGGFLYMVADSSTTGARDQIKTTQIEYFERIRAMNPGIPGMIGFGISNRKTFNTACQYANGAIIGSAFIEALKKQDHLESAIKSFLQGVKLENE